ncbi:hypothetical protein ONZ45_g4572 [Pleurotus djamor]|nr:hypothetical protein ONZ45_g4572 [Pleurotus djamor]
MTMKDTSWSSTPSSDRIQNGRIEAMTYTVNSVNSANSEDGIKTKTNKTTQEVKRKERKFTSYKAPIPAPRHTSTLYTVAASRHPTLALYLVAVCVGDAAGTDDGIRLYRHHSKDIDDGQPQSWFDVDVVNQILQRSIGCEFDGGRDSESWGVDVGVLEATE